MRLFALLKPLIKRNFSLGSIAVLGLLSIFTYYGHFLIDFGIIILLDPENFTIIHMLVLMVVVTAIIWVSIDLYSRLQWGSLSTEYGCNPSEPTRLASR